MIKKIKSIVDDIFYISRITKVQNKKRIIISAVLLSQFIAGADILIILTFTSLLTTTAFDLDNFEFLYILFEFKFFLPLLIITRYLIQYFQNTILKDLQFSISNGIRVYIFKEILERRNFSTADSFFYINTLSTHISFFYSNVSNFLNYFLQAFAFSTFLLLTNFEAILVFIFGILILLYPITQLIKNARKAVHKSFEIGKESNYDIQRIVENLFLIKLLFKQQDELYRYQKRVEEEKNYLLLNHKLGIVNSYIPSFITVLILAIVVNFFDNSFNITLDFTAVTLRMFQALGLLTGAANFVANSHVHMQKFYELEKNQLLNIKPLNTNFTSKQFSVHLNKVSFKYENSDSYLFDEIDIKIPLNKHTIITGPNGSGKSTFLGLISGIYSPQKGEVKVYSNNFAYVGPSPLVLTATLKENLLYGNKQEIGNSEILDMVKKFNLFKNDSQLILEKQIDNKSLSSGQMQKIAFIRALLLAPDILLLDEATSNLDIQTKNMIFELLKIKNITIVNSTHDPSNFSYYDYHLSIIPGLENNKIDFV